MNKANIQMSICTFQDGVFQIIIQDKDTFEEITFDGQKELTDEQFEFVNRIAPACVYTPYKEQ